MGQAGPLVPTMHLGRAGQHEPLLTGRQDRDCEGRGCSVSAPSLFASALPTACNDFISSFVLWLVARLLQQNIGSGRACI